MNRNQNEGQDTPSRWRIFRRLLVFQYKLFIDAAKDFLLSPLAFAAALADIIRPGPPSRMLFPALMRLGCRAEEAINLFDRPAEEGQWTVDRLVDGVESTVLRRGRQRPPDGGKPPGGSERPPEEMD